MTARRRRARRGPCPGRGVGGTPGRGPPAPNARPTVHGVAPLSRVWQARRNGSVERNRHRVGPSVSVDLVRQALLSARFGENCCPIGIQRPVPVPVSPAIPASFTEMAARVSNWGRWGPDDQIGTLNLIDPAARLRGLAAVQDGTAFALGLPLSAEEGIQAGSSPAGSTRPDDGLRQQAAQPRPRVDRLLRGHGHPGHPVRHPLGRAGPRLLRGRAGGAPALQRVPGSRGDRGGGRQLWASTWCGTWCPGGSCWTCPGPGAGDPRSGATPSPPTTWTPPASWPG